MRRLLLFVFLCALGSSITLAQIAVPADLFPPAAPPPAPDTSAADGAANNADKKGADEKPEDAAAKAIRQKRIALIKKIKFDRRPSAILKAWATPLDPEEDKKSKPGQADTVKTGESQSNEEATEKKDENQGDTETAADDKPDDDVRGPEDEELTPEELAEKKKKEEEAQTAKQEAEKKARQEAERKEREAAEQKAFDFGVKKWQRDVSLGKWDDVREFLTGLHEETGKAAYETMIQSLLRGPGRTARSASTSSSSRRTEQNAFNSQDVLGLATAAPTNLERKHIATLGGILRKAISSGNVIVDLVARLEEVTNEKGTHLGRREAARLLFDAGQPLEGGEFLPELDNAKEENDHEALNLLSRFYLAQNADEPSKERLEKAWHVTQAILGADEVEKQEREEALKRAVELAPKVSADLGNQWLIESFTSSPERGMAIIAGIGSQAAQGLVLRPADPDHRLQSLILQTTAVESLLRASPEKAREWSDSLNLLANNWLSEALFSYQYDTSTSRGPSLQRDSYGNYFYFDNDRYTRSSRTTSRGTPITVGKLLDIKPSDEWLTYVFDGMKPKFAMVFAQLFLKVDEDADAFPYVESLAQTHPDKAQDLVKEFLRVWTKNHNPNASRSRTNYYMFSYGYSSRAESIPLTRSKQERNLVELAELVKRLRALPLKELDEELLARAFTTCHSSAEVYQLNAMERVFGSVENMKPETLASLAQQMRANLASVWRQPSVQKDAKTKRKQKDIEAEVIRGYADATALVANGLTKYPRDWRLQLAKAALQLDQINYQQEIAKSSQFALHRTAALAEFRKAAELYAARIDEVEENDETTMPYEHWFYASLGASDLAGVDHNKVPILAEPAKIREAMLALGDGRANRHVSMFANSMFTRMSRVNPSVKFRYLRTGFEIVGDHEQAVEARKVYDYYNDLVSEIKLEAAIDGSSNVGSDEPFGVFINIRHTKEIERESGGFGRYLQNQNNQRYSYNYGRPTENYRDKFEEHCQQVLGEHFDVMSVTFQNEDVHSKATNEPGWRVTPYAYLLLTAKGPEVDKLHPVQLDLDFLDTSGYAVLPVETPALVIDARQAADGRERSLNKLEITQTLDERQEKEGTLVLEVKATAEGLIPKLEDLLDVSSPGFEVAEVEDQGVSISKFAEDSDETQIVSERTWLVSMQAAPGLDELPKTFSFASPKTASAKVLYQRYVDDDMLAVEQNISLEKEYGQLDRPVGWWFVGGFLGLVALIGGILLAGQRDKVVETKRFQVPDKITPFTVLGLLRDIEHNNGLGTSRKQELHTSIDRIEQSFFSGKQEEDVDLEQIARTWVEETN